MAILPKTAVGIHIGASTHHHDQSITCVSFNTIKAIARSPKNPTPPFVASCLLAILVKIDTLLLQLQVGIRHPIFNGFQRRPAVLLEDLVLSPLGMDLFGGI